LASSPLATSGALVEIRSLRLYNFARQLSGERWHHIAVAVLSQGKFSPRRDDMEIEKAGVFTAAPREEYERESSVRHAGFYAILCLSQK
jgi:hypothetical protein